MGKPGVRKRSISVYVDWQELDVWPVGLYGGGFAALLFLHGVIISDGGKKIASAFAADDLL